MTLDDAAVVRSLLAGEPGAWDYFVERSAGTVAGAVRGVLAGRGVRPAPADVDDICEDVFLMLLERDMRLLRRYDPRYRLAAYLGVLARTAAHRWLRRRRPGADLPEDAWEEGVADEDLETISEEATQREVRRVVRRELGGLSDREQRVLRLFYYDGLDYQGIAEALGISVNSVGAALSRARARLGAALRERTDLTESDFRSV